MNILTPPTVYPPHIQKLLDQVWREGLVIKKRVPGTFNIFTAEIHPLMEKVFRLMAAEKNLRGLLSPEVLEMLTKKSFKEPKT